MSLSKKERMEFENDFYKREPQGIASEVPYNRKGTITNLGCIAINKKPKQYDIGIDTFDRMKANCTKEEIIGGCKLNIDKYVWRKKGSDEEDLKKAKDYIDLWIWALGE